MEVYFIVVITLVFLGYLMYGAYKHYGQLKESNQRYQDLQERYKEEKKKPKWGVKFILEDGTLKSSGPIEPLKLGVGMSNLSMIKSSKAAAQSRLWKSYEIGYFKDSEGTTYPACNIKSAWSEELK